MKRRTLLAAGLALLAILGYAGYLHHEGRLGLTLNRLRNAIAPPDFAVAEAQERDPNPVKLGVGATINKRMFPDDNPWNQDISREPVDPLSKQIIQRIGPDKGLHPEFGTFYRG